MTLLEAIRELTQRHGSQAEAARYCDINKSYWSRMMAGVKDWPSEETLKRLGLRRIISYEWVKSPRK
jgi:hypothetical protein